MDRDAATGIANGRRGIRPPQMPRLVDVAEVARVSVATVSRALNESRTVDPVLADRVRAAAAQLGYRPNAIARNLRQRGTRVWALVIADIDDPFHTAFARGVEDAASGLGFSVLLCTTEEDEARERRYLEVAAQERVAGAVLVPRATDSDVSCLLDAGIPVVVADRRLDRGVDFVTAASYEGAVTATEHLLSERWCRPACIARTTGAPAAEPRRQGYQAVVDRHGLPSIGCQIPLRANAAEGVAMVEELLDGDAPDSFLTVDSRLALLVLHALRRRRLRTGRDVGLVSFDDAAWAQVVVPPLSVVDQPAYEIGVAAARLLSERIRGDGGTGPRTVTMSTTLIVRGSSRRPTHTSEQRDRVGETPSLDRSRTPD